MDRGYMETCAVSCVEIDTGSADILVKNPLYIKMDVEQAGIKKHVLMVEVTWIGDDGQVHMRRVPCDKIRVHMRKEAPECGRV